MRKRNFWDKNGITTDLPKQVVKTQHHHKTYIQTQTLLSGLILQGLLQSLNKDCRLQEIGSVVDKGVREKKQFLSTKSQPLPPKKEKKNGTF